MSKQIIITGGAGFIGSNLARRLAGEGNGVCIIDSFDDCYDPAIKRDNAAETLKLYPGVELAEGDIRDSGFLDAAYKSFKPDVIIHLAARPGVRASIADPLLYTDVNIVGTQQLLEACRRHGVGKFIFGSSSSVYGVTSRIPFSEEDPCDRPVSPYAATKRVGEIICANYSHLFGLGITCLRFFTVYGPMQRPEMAIHKFSRLISGGHPIPMYGDGSSKRDYTYVDDIVQGVGAALEKIEGYRIYNLGNSQTTELSKLIQIVGDVLGQKPKINREPDQQGDVPITFADITKSRQELGYNPETSIEDGVEKFVEWFRARGSRPG
ncbi:MAG: NAD-dependent epimerase/dehydratase family protein [Planctomycetota bacterium]|nr:MAG: NAD-dependent epimerase/dehydratase family protein [Planctomycetota bacterium]